MKCSLEENNINDKYQLSGLFYYHNKDRYRKQIEIKWIHSIKLKHDLMIVMMNPGGANTKDGYEKVYNKLVPVKSDQTQKLIMEYMNQFGFEFARIINLSDYCASKSTDFFKKLTSLNNMEPNHSLFHKSRKSDLNELFIKNVPVLLAWGVNERIKELAEKALSFLKDEGSEIHGLNSTVNNLGYYHPLRRPFKSWLKGMEKLKNSLQNDTHK